jgi:hypothetical protein
MRTHTSVLKIRTTALLSALAFSICLGAGPALSDGLGHGLGGGLGGVGNAVGGVVGGVTGQGTGGGVTKTVNGALGSVTGTVNSVTGTVNSVSVNTSDSVGVNAKSNLLGGTNVQLQALSKAQLLKLCVSVGASGCGGGSRVQLLNAITGKLGILKPNALASLCLSVGGGCGDRTTNGGGPGGGGGGGTRGGGNHPPGTRTASNTDVYANRKFCISILRNPQYYGEQFVALCKSATRWID